ncbi:hypothetical protein H1C71_028825 [Ictidomys tridecemlineatus]|nr:hypothetical protein H1C71_028825 [Ictidomys tridecemlineatus]
MLFHESMPSSSPHSGTLSVPGFYTLYFLCVRNFPPFLSLFPSVSLVFCVPFFRRPICGHLFCSYVQHSLAWWFLRQEPAVLPRLAPTPGPCGPPASASAAPPLAAGLLFDTS